MNIAKETFKFVPVPNLVENTDEDYINKLYDLSPDEIKYIESIVRPME